MDELYKPGPALMERVDAGVAWADENLPHWREYINPRTFDIAEEDRCFLGQCWLGFVGHNHTYSYESPFYSGVLCLLDGSFPRAGELGFMLGDAPDYYALNMAWRAKFRELGLLDGINEDELPVLS